MLRALNKRTIVVFGATGRQGSSVCDCLMQTGEFNVIGITRNSRKPASQALTSKGITMRDGDLQHPASYEGYLREAHGVFLNIDYWSLYERFHDAERAMAEEIHMGINCVDACKRAKIKHLVYSTLDSYLPRIHVPHFDSKAAITAHINTVRQPATQLYTSLYFDELLTWPIHKENGKILIVNPLPDEAVIPCYAPSQTGLWVRHAFLHPDVWIGHKRLECVGELMTLPRFAEVLTEATKYTVDVEHKSRQEFLDNTANLDREIWIVFKGYLDMEMQRNVEKSRAIVPEAWDFAEWVEENAEVRAKFT